MDNVFWLNGFPLPPSVNNGHMPVSTGKIRYNRRGQPYMRARIIKTGNHKDYENTCLRWQAMNSRAVMVMRNSLLQHRQEVEAQGKRFALRVECFFAFSEAQMWSAKEAPDADNRLKPCLDALKKILELDDVLYFATLSEKVTTTTKETECSLIRISPMTHRTLDEVKAQMFREATA